MVPRIPNIYYLWGYNIKTSIQIPKLPWIFRTFLLILMGKNILKTIILYSHRPKYCKKLQCLKPCQHI